ncbi:MAG: tRNA dihydrouridine synthase DusB [Lachnospiraceae bacterium]|nr:tRNA dihydrouridine synthase DusB [Lachnospiraceae bacterium]
MRIGSVDIGKGIIAAPMAGISDLPFRLLCARYGSDLECMEMISAKAITYRNRNTAALMEIGPDEGYVSLQLFGSEPEVMAEAVRMIQHRPYHILDINMGCPVPKIVNNGEGSALMKDPQLAGRIVDTIVRVSDKPVTVKIRSGFDPEHINAVEMAHVLEESGASAVCVHGRTREQYYSGQADWDVIAAVKSAVSIPVIGNGDVRSAEDFVRMQQETGCDGVMIGRALQGNPWLLKDIRTYLETGSHAEPPTAQEKIDTILEHGRMLIEHKGEYIGIREMRKHTAWYTAGVPGSAAFRGRINGMESYDELVKAITELYDRHAHI